MKATLSYRVREYKKAEDYIPADKNIFEITEEIVRGDGRAVSPYNININIKNISENEFKGVICVNVDNTADEYVNKNNAADDHENHEKRPLNTLVYGKDEPQVFMPGFMYGSNRADAPLDVPRKYPRLRPYSNFPASNYFMVRGDRLSHPAVLVYEKGRVTGFDAKPYETDSKGEFLRFNGYMCSMNEAGDHISCGYTLGYENAPWLFIQSTTIEDRKELSEENIITIGAGETISFAINVYDYEASEMIDVHDAIINVYNTYHKGPRVVPGFGIKEAIENIAGAISRDAWLPEKNCYSGFVFMNKEGEYSYNELGSLSWTNGLSVALPMLLAGIRTGNKTMKKQAETFIERVVHESINEKSGLPFDAVNDKKWSTHGWWFDNMHTPGHSAYLAGQAMYYIMKAYEYEKRLCDTVHEEWLSYVKPVLEVFEANKNRAHEYPFVFSEYDGSGLEYDSMSGAWCFAAIAYYEYLTGDRTYIESLIKSEKHYYDKFVKRLACYGAPLDTDKAIDSEGILAYIRGVRYLHELAKENDSLSNELILHMKAGLDYEFTYKFCYNSPVRIKPLSDIKWSSCGGSITSTCNPHIHPMSSTIVDEMLYYYKLTGDEYVHLRMVDTVRWGCQTYNFMDGEYGYGKKGWMSERFCYSEGLVTEKYEDGSPASTWFALMPWAGASIVEGLTGDYYDSVVK